MGALVVLACLVPSRVWGQEDVRSLRRAYNEVAARIDSLVRVMAASDEKALDTEQLPRKEDGIDLPAGSDLVMIFWADDEAKVWLNDYFVGETRLVPVEVSVPSLYLKGTNRLRARCWDTDWVESGFLCGLYLRTAGGALHPIVVSNRDWSGPEGSADEITYAHSLPDVPGAEPIWGAKVFGAVDLEVSFEGSAVQEAVDQATAGVSRQRPDAMRYHDFVQQMTVLEGERERLLAALSAYSAKGRAIEGVVASGTYSHSMTLGKAGPLEEGVSLKVSEDVREWAEQLPEEKQEMIYPDRRALKGEDAATAEMLVGAGGRNEAGERTGAYVPPPERNRTEPGIEDGRGGRGAGGQGDGEAEGSGWSGGGGGGRASRLGLLIPTAILSLYVIYVLMNWKKLGESR